MRRDWVGITAKIGGETTTIRGERDFLSKWIVHNAKEDDDRPEVQWCGLKDERASL